MTDHLTSKERSRNMAAIKSKNTSPEIKVRSLLHRNGYRFRLYNKNLPGKPDIILPKYNTVIFVHGCFWHRHTGCKDCTTPKTNKKYWTEKFNKNIKRDKYVQDELKQLGWNVIVIWQCELKEQDKLIKELCNKRNVLSFCRVISFLV